MVFKEIEVIKTQENNHYIEWDMTPEFNGDLTDDYNFKISWSEDPSSGFIFVTDEHNVQIVIDGADGPLSYTHPRRQNDFSINYYYKIHCIKKDSPFTEIVSDAQFIGDAFQGFHLVMKRNEQLLMDQYAGNPSTVIKKKSFGTHCTNCWDNLRKQTYKSKCPICNGTGLVVGYYQPISIQIAWGASQSVGVVQESGKDVTGQIQVRMSNYPIVKPGDLIINNDTNRRYKILSPISRSEAPLRATFEDGVRKLSRSNYIVSQLLILKEIVSSDPEYDLRPGNISEVPQIEEPGGAFINFHKAATGTAPINVNSNQVVSLSYSSNDFYLESGVLRSRQTPSDISFVAGEDFIEINKAVYVNNDGSIGIAKYDVEKCFNRVIGVNVSIGLKDSLIVVKLSGIVNNELWDWVLGRNIFFDDNGSLTQTYIRNLFWQPIATPVSATSLLINIQRPILIV